MPPTDASYFANQLDILRLRFLDGLVPRVLVLEQNAIALRRNPADLDALQSIRRECHKLAGVSASFGFDDIGALASCLDVQLSSEPTDWPGVEPQLERLMDLMEHHLEAANGAT